MVFKNNFCILCSWGIEHLVVNTTNSIADKIQIKKSKFWADIKKKNTRFRLKSSQHLGKNGQKAV